MKTSSFIQSTKDLESVMSVCCGSPRGDELPQVGTVDDFIVDIFAETTNQPRELVAGWLHHQYEDDLIH